jgi:lipoprotein NlpD
LCRCCRERHKATSWTDGIIDLFKIHYTVRAEPVEALLPFDKLRANGIGLPRIMKSSIICKKAIGSGVLALAAACALLFAGCAAIAPAPVSERTPPPKPAPPVTAAKPDARVVARPLPPAGATYTVRQGDTLFSIARAHGVDFRELAGWNNIDPASIKVGQQLRLTPPDGVAATPMKPPPGGVETRPLDSGVVSADPAMKTQPLGQRVPYSDEAYARMAKVQPAATPEVKLEVKPAAKPDTPRGDGEVDWAWPTAGKVVASFDGTSSKGISVSGKMGQPVYASAAGKVTYTGIFRGLGRIVVVQHNKNYLSVYAHNSNVVVKQDQLVSKGQKISEMGNSDADQVKLHFEIRRQGKPVDPITLLPAL